MADNAKRAVAILERLKAEYPKTKHYINFTNTLELLVATILSAQTRDTVVNGLTPALFAKYKTANDYANASLDELTEMVAGVTYFGNKAKYIKEACAMIDADFDGKVPGTMKELTSLPGVGRKSANAILIHGFNVIEGIAVDTHVIRLSNRMALTKESNPDKIEKDLKAIVPQSYWKTITSLMKDHGRAVCGTKPKCESCVVSSLCPKVGV
ncbi:endonuclease III [Candidatus Acetothermia bacterium]|nr:endonuclease III [Candidatus Acetothermia bacterium]MBI3643141.1 endonuclease III [Candidatus Acetothermia bacterium]